MGQRIVIKQSVLGLCAVFTILSGCAEKSENIQAAYVSPLSYQGMSCRQIEAEARRVSSRVAQVSGVQDKNASDDAVATGVALVLFWPAAFFIKGNKQNSAELSRLKGELEAIEKASIARNCGIVFRAPEPSKPAETEEKPERSKTQTWSSPKS